MDGLRHVWECASNKCNHRWENQGEGVEKCPKCNFSYVLFIGYTCSVDKPKDDEPAPIKFREFL